MVRDLLKNVVFFFNFFLTIKRIKEKIENSKIDISIHNKTKLNMFFFFCVFFFSSIIYSTLPDHSPVDSN